MIRNIPKSIWAIGISSLLINSATVVIFSASALYLKTVLEVSITYVGTLEAIVEGIAYLTRTFSGVMSDYFRRRKWFMVFGFSLLTISKPMLAFSSTYVGIFISRTIDRLGNGLQASPRDALVSDLAPKEIKGTCYGFRQSLGLIGSTIGGLLGILVMRQSNNNFKLLFLLAGIPAVFALCVLILFVKEKINNHSETTSKRKIKLSSINELGKKFWLLMILVIFFMMGKFSEVFICLRACDDFGLNVAWGTIFPVIYSLVSALVAYPIGRISDKIDRKNVLLFGFIIFTLSHLLIGLAPNLYFIFLGTMLWGTHEGITDSMFASLISDYVPKELRGTGFGLYSLLSSLSMMVANIIAGYLSSGFGIHMLFVSGAVLGIITIVILLVIKPLLCIDNKGENLI
ncbi:MAG: MFS transporter [Alphaproteobacteria bacterium]|nr:MFS transporter [Alphaproteobacteria bacterium]